MKRRLLFYCQHVLGMGHLARSREIVKGLSNFDVWFVNGGEPVHGFDFPSNVQVVQLPPVSSDSEFQEVRGAHDGVFEERKHMLIELLHRVKPHGLIVEMFPFGRRKFAQELIPLLEARDRTQTRTICSVRDILVAKKDQTRHEGQVIDWLNRYFDLVLVHSDWRMQSLEETFTRMSDVTCPLEYTGFVAEVPVHAFAPRVRGGRPKVVASAGGGKVGFELLNASVQAANLLNGRIAMDVYTGPFLAEDLFEQLKAQSSPWVKVERFAPDFLDRLAAADLLVSMAGYNTCMNILATGIRALVHPFTGNGNDEQLRRARNFERMGILGVIEDGELNAHLLADRIESALQAPTPGSPVDVDLSGVASTAGKLERWLPYV